MFQNLHSRQSSLEDNHECSERMRAISALLESEEHTEAREQLGSFTERFPDDAAAHAFASLSYSQLGDVANAIAENACAMALCPSDPAGYERLAGLLRQKGYRQAADQMQGKTWVVIEEKIVRRINSPLALLVSALTGVACSFAPLGLYWAGGAAGSFANLFQPRTLLFAGLCWATIYVVSLFYISIAAPVVAQVYQRKKVTKTS